MPIDASNLRNSLHLEQNAQRLGNPITILFSIGYENVKKTNPLRSPQLHETIRFQHILNFAIALA